MSDTEKKRRGRPAKDSGNITVSNNETPVDNTEVNPTLKKTLTVPKSVDVNEEEEHYQEPESSVNGNMSDFDKQLEEEIENEYKNTEDTNDIPDDDSDNPLLENVKDRAYTDGIVDNNIPNIENAQIVEEEIAEPIYTGGTQAMPEVDETLVNPNANSDKKTNSFTDNPKNDGGNNTNNTSSTPPPKSEPKKEEPKQEKSDNLKELSPKEKREAIEKTAEVILLAYQQYCPVPFVYFSSFDEKKLEKLHDGNEINLDRVVKRDGSTFKQYVEIFNRNVDEQFVVTDKEIEELREPLIDVLSENEIAFTPTQRLLFTLGQQLAGKIFLTVKFLREKHSDIKQMREMHQETLEKLEAIRVQNEKIIKKNGVNQNQNTNQNQQQSNQNINMNPEGYKNPPTNENIKVSETKAPVVEPEQNNDKSHNVEPAITDAKVVEVKNNKNTIMNTPSLDDVLADNKEEIEGEVEDGEKNNENDIPNE